MLVSRRNFLIFQVIVLTHSHSLGDLANNACEVLSALQIIKHPPYPKISQQPQDHENRHHCLSEIRNLPGTTVYSIRAPLKHLRYAAVKMAHRWCNMRMLCISCMMQDSRCAEEVYACPTCSLCRVRGVGNKQIELR